ncbi:hypothetical protein Q3G72_022974 [Acer saccharum]|nr:hypothetical protein Q3G72_022974 [Acer saccharum]
MNPHWSERKTFTGQEDSREKKDSNNHKWKLEGLDFSNCNVGVALHRINLSKPKKTGAKPYRWDASLFFTMRKKLEDEQLVKEGKEKLENEQHKKLTAQLVELFKEVELVKEGKEKVMREQHKKLKARLVKCFKEAELVKEAKRSWIRSSIKSLWHDLYDKTYLTTELDDDSIGKCSVEHNTENYVVLKFSYSVDLSRRSLWTGVKVFPMVEVKKNKAKKGSEVKKGGPTVKEELVIGIFG